MTKKRNAPPPATRRGKHQNNERRRKYETAVILAKAVVDYLKEGKGLEQMKPYHSPRQILSRIIHWGMLIGASVEYASGGKVFDMVASSSPPKKLKRVVFSRQGSLVPYCYWATSEAYELQNAALRTLFDGIQHVFVDKLASYDSTAYIAAHKRMQKKTTPPAIKIDECEIEERAQDLLYKKHKNVAIAKVEWERVEIREEYKAKAREELEKEKLSEIEAEIIQSHESTIKELQRGKVRYGLFLLCKERFAADWESLPLEGILRTYATFNFPDTLQLVPLNSLSYWWRGFRLRALDSPRPCVELMKDQEPPTKYEDVNEDFPQQKRSKEKELVIPSDELDISIVIPSQFRTATKRERAILWTAFDFFGCRVSEEKFIQTWNTALREVQDKQELLDKYGTLLVMMLNFSTSPPYL